MALFEVPNRVSRSADNKLAKKSKSSKKAVSTVRGGNDLFGRINEIKAMVEKNLGDYKDKYLIINNEEVLHDYITECIGNSYLSVDTETNGLDPLQNKLVGICPYTYGQRGAYIPLNHISYVTGMKAQGQLSMDFVMSEFKRLLKTKPQIDMFNAKFDIRFLRANGLPEIYCTWDGYLASQLLNENEPTHGLKALHKKYILGDKKDAFSFDSLFKGVTFDKIPINVGYLYAANDPVITSELCDYQRKHLRLDHEREDLRNMAWVFHNIEMPCINVVADMEDAGIELDLEYTEKLSEKYNKLLEDKIQDFQNAVSAYSEQIEKYRAKKGSECKLDNPINIGSPTQIAILIYDIMGEQSVDPKKPRGTGEDILSKIDNPVCKAILEYREVSKLVTTYIDKLPECVNPNDGRIHCSFNQYGAKTGRFSSSDPNLQNIPSHNKDIRKMFVASNDESVIETETEQFVVDRWCEIECVDGWKYADSIVVKDVLKSVEGEQLIVKGVKVQKDNIIIDFT